MATSAADRHLRASVTGEVEESAERGIGHPLLEGAASFLSRVGLSLEATNCGRFSFQARSGDTGLVPLQAAFDLAPTGQCGFVKETKFLTQSIPSLKVDPPRFELHRLV